MAAKTTVYIPDDLHEEVQKHEDINVSGILQTALRKELDIRESTSGLSPEVAAVRRKMEESSEKTFGQLYPGPYQDGRRSAGDLALGDLEEVEAFYTENVENESVSDVNFYIAKEALADIFDFDYLGIRRSGPLAAFLSGVSDVYREASEG